MKRLSALAIGVMLSGLYVVTAAAEGSGNLQGQNPAAKVEEKQDAAAAARKAAERRVPKAQRDYQKKREEARKRRDQLIKQREMNIDAAERAGN
jgi:hypothetical protein